MFAIVITYLAFCFGIAYLGTDRKFGYWGYFFCSLFLTPFVGAIVLLGSDRRIRVKKCPRCNYQLSGPRQVACPNCSTTITLPRS